MSLFTERPNSLREAMQTIRVRRYEALIRESLSGSNQNTIDAALQLLRYEGVLAATTAIRDGKLKNVQPNKESDETAELLAIKIPTAEQERVQRLKLLKYTSSNIDYLERVSGEGEITFADIEILRGLIRELERYEDEFAEDSSARQIILRERRNLLDFCDNFQVLRPDFSSLRREKAVA